MRNILIVFFVLIGLHATIKTYAQIPSTQESIDRFIDSLGASKDRYSITSKLLPGITDGTNAKCFLQMVYNKNDELLWVEDKIPDSVSTAYIFCKDRLIFVSHFSYTYILDTVSRKQKPIFRKIYFDNELVISDSSPASEPYTTKYFLHKSKEHLAHFKTKDQ